jgi:hypothetical protein
MAATTPRPYALPTEIWAHIFDLVPFVTAKKLRLVNEAFSDLGAVHVFKVVYVMRIRLSLENLRHIADDEHLSEHV